MRKIKKIFKKTQKIKPDYKAAVLLISLSLINILFPHKAIIAAEPIQSSSWFNLGELREVVIYNPERTPVTYEVAWTRYVPVTAYTSCIYETDASPFTTANGTIVRDGLVAANFLRLGTKIRIPEYFGAKIFEVQDRMNARYYYNLDVWMKGKEDARNFGRRFLKIEVLKEVPKELAQAK